jgi:hypothetical protein
MTTKKSTASLPAFDPESGDTLAVVETPKGSRNKFAYDQGLEAFDRRRDPRAPA